MANTEPGQGAGRPQGQRGQGGRPQGERGERSQGGQGGQGGHGGRGGSDRRGGRGGRPRGGGSGSAGGGHRRGGNDDKDEKREKKPFVPWLGEERPSKGPILDLETYENKGVLVSFVGGREITGTLTGFDSFMNLVLDDVTEFLDDGKTRSLGTLVARGPLVQSISPVEGTAPIENPF